MHLKLKMKLTGTILSRFWIEKWSGLPLPQPKNLINLALPAPEFSHGGGFNK